MSMASLDVLVIGGGIVGCACALAASRRGPRVGVVERGRVGGEATSAAAGLICAQYGADEDSPLFRLRLAGRDAFPAFAEMLEELGGASVGYRNTPTLRLAWTEDEHDELKRRVEWQRAAGLDASLIAGEEARRLAPYVDPAIVAGALFPDTQVNTQRLGPIMHRALQAAGVVVHDGVEVVRIRSARPSAVLDTTAGVLTAAQLVVAAGAWTGTLMPHVPVGPLKGHVVAFEGAPLTLQYVINTSRGSLVQRDDGRILIGATQENEGFDHRLKTGAIATLLASAIWAIPALSGRALDGMWTGFRPLAPDGLPTIGRDARSGSIVASGHFTHGITIAWLTGEIVARLISGDDPGYPIDPFNPGRFGQTSDLGRDMEASR